MSLSSVLSGTSSGSSSSTASSSTSATAGSPVSFTGLVSGINTSSIIAKLTQLEQNQVTAVQNQQANLSNQQQIYQQVSSYLGNMSTAAGTLSSYGAFNLVSGNSSTPATATVSAGLGATAGTYSLSVSQLAQAQKISTTAQTNTTTALGLAGGTFVVNGEAVQVTSADSLKTIAQKINGLNNGVTASLIDGGSGSAYMTLAANNSGLANQLQIADLSGNTLSTLGITSGTATTRTPQTNGALSYGFTSSSQTLASMMGLPTGGTYNFSINGGSAITVNTDTDSLQSVANKINATGSGVSATVNTVTSGSNTTYQLSITSPSGTTFSDTNGLLQGLGVLQSAPGNQLVQAKDANYSLDGVNLTSSSNTITSAIPGATLTLLQGNTTTSGVTSPSTSTITLNQNTSTIISNVNAFVSAFNNVTDYINQNSQFNSTNFQSGPLFGDPVARQVQTSMSNMIFANVPGTTGQYTNLAALGFSFNASGDLTVNSTTLTSALTTNPSAVTALFQASGTGSSANLNFVSSGSKSVPTGTGSYAINITQPATQQVYTATTAQTTANPSTENLTFSGQSFGSAPYVLALPAGATLDSTIAAINNDATLKNFVVATNNNGFLNIQSQVYGGKGNFTVVSSSDAASNTSGIGKSGGTYVYGNNLIGTINGELATGNGQYLVGNSGNKTTDGLQIQYTGTSTGAVGTIKFNNGIAVQAQSLASTLTDSANGVLTAASNGLTAQITELNKKITQLNTDLTNQTSTLQTEFSNMESAIAAAQQQSTQLNSILKG